MNCRASRSVGVSANGDSACGALRHGLAWYARTLGIGLVFAALQTAQTAQAAQVSDSDWAKLRAEAESKGHAAVLVHLVVASLQQISTKLGAVSATSQAQLEVLSSELGDSALRHGRWANGMGQAQLHLTLLGLDRLRQSNAALSFMRGKPWQELSGLDGLDGGLEQIEQAITRDGFADIEIIPNIDGLQFELLPDGSTRLSADPSAVSAAMERLRPVLQSAGGVIDSRNITQALRVSRDGLLALAYSGTVRHLRPRGHVDARPREVDPTLAEAANTGADVQFILSLRSGISGGRLTDASRRVVATSHRAALQALLGQVGSATLVQDYSQLGAAQVRMTSTALKSMLAGTDRRWLAATPLRAVGKPQLATSAGSMNMSAAWNLGYFGAGQNVIVFDTGVQANHPFFGARVIYQACFGTTGLAQVGFANYSAQYTSYCPGATLATNWDSPPNTPNAAAPILNSSHGTLVAGIAAGGLKTQPPPQYRGLASSANIVAVQMFSQHQADTIPALVNADMLAALTEAFTLLPILPAPQQQPYTLILSAASEFHSAPCTTGVYAPYANAALLLTNAGVPVVAASGNDGFDNAVSFPACLP